MERKTFAVLGGDLRQYWVARGLKEQGYAVKTFALTDPDGPLPQTQTLQMVLAEADYVILPVPAFTGDGTLNAQGVEVDRETLLTALRPGAWVFGGKLGSWADAAADHGMHPVDYLALEEMAVANAIPAAAAK